MIDAGGPGHLPKRPAKDLVRGLRGAKAHRSLAGLYNESWNMTNACRTTLMNYPH